MKPIALKVILLGTILTLGLCSLQLNAQMARSMADGYLLPALVGKSAADEAENKGMASYCLETATCSYEASTVQVSLASTMGDMQQLLNTKMVSGVFYQENPAAEENSWAVIDEALAIQLFFSTDVLGRTLLIDQTAYTVCGVVQSNHEGLQAWLCDGFPRVYIAANSTQGRANGAALSWCASTQEVHHKAAAATAFSQDSGSFIVEEDVIDFVSLKQMAVALKNTGLFALLSAAVFLACYLLRTYLKKVFRSFSDMVLPALSLGTAACAITVFITSAPSALLPNHNIFDFTYYRNEMITLMQMGNFIGGDIRFYLGQSICILVLLTVITALMYGLFILFVFTCKFD